MSAFHIVIAAERRTAEETPLGLDTSRLAHQAEDQLYTLTATQMPEHPEDDQFIYIAEWDLRSPYIIVHKGAGTELKGGGAGWPTVTKEEYDALPADL